MRDFNSSYVGERTDILELLPKGTKKILDIGCSIGSLAEQLKAEDPSREITGIEQDQEMAKAARNKMDRVISADIEKIDLLEYLSLDYFDCIIFADVLEHLIDPWQVLKSITRFLKNDKVIIASIPNIRHYSSVGSLLFGGYWPYRERGINDKNHLRFFALANIKEMFLDAGLEIVTIRRKYRIIERPHYINKCSKFFALPLIRDFITFQYLIVARKVQS